MMPDVSSFVLLTGLLWCHVCTAHGDTLVLNKSSCGQSVSHNDRNHLLKVELNLGENCERCQGSFCPGSRPESCSVYFKMDYEFLKIMYRICVDLSNFKTSSCYAQVTIVPSGSSFSNVMITCGLPSLNKAACSSESVVAKITYTNPADLCASEGYVTVYLQRLSIDSLSYDLTDVKRCQRDRSINIEHASYRVSSWYNASFGGKPSFCQVKFLAGSNRDGLSVCLNFHHAFFPRGGAKLVVQKNIYSYESRPKLETEYCIDMTNYPHTEELLVSIEAGGKEGNDTNNQHFDHAIVFTIRAKSTETQWGTSWDDDDYYNDSSEEDSEFQKKVIIAVAVFCVALFVCMYYACSKSKQQISTQQEPQSELGPEPDEMRRPYYESDPINRGQNDTYTYVHPTSTLTDNPEPTVITSDNRERNNRARRDRFDQPPPDYAHISHTSSAPAAPREAGAGDQQASASHGLPAAPPAYESLFPNKND